MPPVPAQQLRPLLFSFALTRMSFNNPFFPKMLEEIS